MSYRFDLWAIELTKVDLFTALNAKGEPLSEKPASTTFEVEAEIKASGMDMLRREAAKVRAGQPNEFVRIATGQTPSNAVGASKYFVSRVLTFSLLVAAFSFPRYEAHAVSFRLPRSAASEPQRLSLIHI